MPTKTDGKNVVKTEPKQGLINRYGGSGGAHVLFDSRMREFFRKGEQSDEPPYVRVQSDTERLVKRGRWSPK